MGRVPVQELRRKPQRELCVEVLEVAVELGRKPCRVLWVIPMLEGLMAVLVAVLVELAMKSSKVLCVNDFVFRPLWCSWTSPCRCPTRCLWSRPVTERA